MTEEKPKYVKERYNRILKILSAVLGIDDMNKVEKFYLAGMKALIECNSEELKKLEENK